VIPAADFHPTEPQMVNGASDFLVESLGAKRGPSCTVGSLCSVLPWFAVEIEGILKSE